jgi:hypothetical protein
VRVRGVPVARAGTDHELAVNPVIYAEMSLSLSRIEALDAVVKPMAALFLAGKAFAITTS